MNPTIKLFREKFANNNSLVTPGSREKLEQFILSEKQKAREEVLGEVEKKMIDMRKLEWSEYNIALADLQHHISKMRDNKTDV